MATGATHARNARRVIWLSIPVSLAIALRFDAQAIAGIGGAVAGWLIEPDMDLHNITTRSERRMHRVSPLLGWVWEVYWYPYARAIPHRSPLSHLPPLCTLIRIAYILLTIWLGLRVWGASFDALTWLLDNWHSARWAYWALAWWIVQDFVHLAADGWRVKKRRR